MTNIQKNKRGPLAWGIMLVLTLIWGSSFILMKKGLVVFDPGEVAGIRVMIAGLFLFPMALKAMKGLRKKQVFLLAVSGFVGVLAPAFLFATAQTQLDSAISGVLNALVPLNVLVVGALFYGQKIFPQHLLGIMIGFVGTAVLVLSGQGNDLNSVNMYALLIVVATFMYGNNLNLVKFHLSDLNSMVISSVSIFIMGLFASVYLFSATDFVQKLTEEDGAIMALAYLVILGGVGTALAISLFNKLLLITDPIFSSSTLYLVPIVAVMWGLLDGEVISFSHYVGVILIIFGVYFSNRRKRSVESENRFKKVFRKTLTQRRAS
ncbi:DMT family transporter [Xanthovirga aplysinae]|uniref:DMT family transporter n=1 Tax=Xanthovirga aplysinae TaxID=2529853 RepID=UPI0012BCAF86|nr:EamA family transporter [Xanthovirga aplysinae]MTI29967.1 EamA family transporter [Xanthovirga aplysinae]